MKGRAFGTAVAFGVSLLAVGAATGVLLTGGTTPGDLRAAAEVTSAPVGEEEFADERTVGISLVRSPAAALVLGVTGRVTWTGCVAGRPLTSGSVVARINGAPIIALATSLPLYRDLGPGDKGADVRALQAELARLGYGIVVDGSYGPATKAVMKRLQRASGVHRPEGAVAVGSLLWLPGPKVTPQSCDLVRGGYVSSGQSVAKAPSQLTSITIDSMPAGAVAGRRTIRTMGVSGALGADGVAGDREFLHAVAGTQEYRLLDASGKDAQLTAVIALAEPVHALKVPPGALFGVVGDRGCLQSGSRTYTVRIVGSKLGVALLALTGEGADRPPQQVNVGTAISASSCR